MRQFKKRAAFISRRHFSGMLASGSA